jgi:hypothetical protein
MSALPPKADIAERDCHVRFVPKADIGREDIKSGSSDRLVRRWPLSAAIPIVGTPHIEDVQYRAIGRCGPGALGDRFCQQTFQFAKIANLRADVIEMMPSDLANFPA